MKDAKFWVEFRKHWAKLPNFFTEGRGVFSLAAAYLLARGHWEWALIVFILVASTDKIDGWLARRVNKKTGKNNVTLLGAFLDALVDKIFIVATLVAESIVDPLMLVVTAIVAFREVYVFLFLRRANRRGRDVAVVYSGKVKMVVQCVAIGFKMLPLTGYWRDVQWAFIGVMLTLTYTSWLDYQKAFRDAKRKEQRKE